MIKITKYDITHLDHINSLYASHSLPPKSGECLPKLGYVAYQGDTPIASGFLRMVEGGYCQIDSLVTNKDAASDLRHKALTLLVDTLVNEAKALNLKGIFATTVDNGTLARAISLGFRVLPYVSIALPLQES